ncbi:hypothetical protein [Neptunicella marina]|uniref:Uncharacterized protein n=1 Tax=Neptunicella marina TaxID=2125989 RepID=A0A8J6LXV9_9ALTE|nr:hypothetical protein [Neptunicella marina]MBC3765050.1 hypothetical protein [Neptunicella marina]
MNTHFLCPPHRQWLSQNLRAAESHYFHAADTAQYFIEQRDWTSALPYCGCAFETLEIILSGSSEPLAHQILNFTHSGILLAKGFGQLGRLDDRASTYQRCIDRLQLQLTINHSLQHNQLITDCLQALQKGLQTCDLRHHKQRSNNHVSYTNFAKSQLH